MKTIALIPARGGSKGLPGKNLMDFCGKPLIAWSIESALQSKEIDAVYVSTDSEDIARISREYGALVPFLRPSDISGDQATTESAMLHFCKYSLAEGLNISNLVLLQATSPIRIDGRLDEAVRYYIDNSFDSLLSVSKVHRFFWKKHNREPSASYDFRNRPRRQDIEEKDESFVETGSFYISNFNLFMKYENRLFGNIGLFETLECESYEIDTALDFRVCETISKYINGAK